MTSSNSVVNTHNFHFEFDHVWKHIKETSVFDTRNYNSEFERVWEHFKETVNKTDRPNISIPVHVLNTLFNITLQNTDNNQRVTCPFEWKYENWSTDKKGNFVELCGKERDVEFFTFNTHRATERCGVQLVEIPCVQSSNMSSVILATLKDYNFKFGSKEENIKMLLECSTYVALKEFLTIPPKEPKPFTDHYCIRLPEFQVNNTMMGVPKFLANLVREFW